MTSICQDCKFIRRRMSDLGFSREMAELLVFRWDRLALLKHRYECAVFKSLEAYDVRRVLGLASHSLSSPARAESSTDDSTLTPPPPSADGGTAGDCSGA